MSEELLLRFGTNCRMVALTCRMAKICLQNTKMPQKTSKAFFIFFELKFTLN